MSDVTILVHHNDNDKYHVSVPVGESVTTHVGANETVPSLDPSGITLNWTDQRGNSISQPTGTQVTWATVPDTSKATDYEGEPGYLNIKFSDGTTTYIEIPVVVQGATAGDVQVVYQNDPVPAASGSVNTSTVDHFGVNSDVWSKAPSTANPGAKSPGTVRVNYSDGTYQDVDVDIMVIVRPKVSIPTGEKVITHVGANETVPSLDPSKITLNWTDENGNSIQAPTGITVVWETVPDTTKIANETGILNVKFANGSITRLGIPVIVKGAKQGEVQTVYVGDPVPSAKKAVDTTDVDNYFDISSIEWLASDTPSTAVVGNNIKGMVRVTYSDGTYQDVSAAINVISNGGDTPTIPWTKIDPQPKPNPDKPKTDPTPDKNPDKDDQPKQPEQKPEVEKHNPQTTKVTEKPVIQKVIKKNTTVSVTKPVNKSVAKQDKQKAILPQTGAKQNSLTAILGSLAIMVGLSALAFMDKKKKN
jgi:LPXTG-motif cell wall-anchored protein